MDTTGIRKTTDKAIAHEAETGVLAQRVRDACAAQHPEWDEAHYERQCVLIVVEIKAYVESMVDVVTEVTASAEREGVADEVVGVLETAVQYVEEEIDFIPDTIGLAGLLDDAYMVHGLMVELSQRQRMLTGRPLLEKDYIDWNRRIRRMIGEPTSTRLDAAIIALSRKADVRTTIERIVERIGNRGISADLPVKIEFEAAGEIPDLQLGSLGG